MVTQARGMAQLGTESAFEVLAQAKALEADGGSIINLGIGQPDFQTAPHIVEAACKALRDGHHGYTPAEGIPALRDAVAADLHRRHGVEVDPGQVLIVPGGKVTLFFAVLMFGEPGVEILYPDPGFPIYASAIRFVGAEPVPVPLRETDGFAFSADAVLERITPRTRLVILNNPANPTGAVTPRAEIDRLATGLLRHPQVAVLSDEIYSRLVYGDRSHASLLQYEALRDRVILLEGWSKSYAMTGWRLGYGVWPPDLIEGAGRLAVNSHSCVNTAAQFAGIAALNGPQDSVTRMIAAFDERRRYIIPALNRLPGLRCGEPGGAFYAFPNIGGTGLSAKAMEQRLLREAGVATLAGSSFGRQGESYLRISYANNLDNIAVAVERLETWLTNHRDAQ